MAAGVATSSAVHRLLARRSPRSIASRSERRTSGNVYPHKVSFAEVAAAIYREVRTSEAREFREAKKRGEECWSSEISGHSDSQC